MFGKHAISLEPSDLAVRLLRLANDTRDAAVPPHD
jgi:hypothetical protein